MAPVQGVEEEGVLLAEAASGLASDLADDPPSDVAAVLPLAEAPAPALAAEPAVALSEALSEAFAAAPAGADAGALPPLKSVTYQPEPLSWKPAAVTCFLKAAAWHAGQS